MSGMRPRRRKIRWTRLVLLLIILLVVLGSLSWAAVYTYKKISSAPVFNAKVEMSKQSEPVSNHINILLMGVDDGDKQDTGDAKRSDTMIVASINPEDGKVNLLSIPRDTRVTIPGYKGAEKITHAYFYGGSQLAVRTVQDMLHLPIHHWIVIDWQAFIKTIDLLGGVDLYVENNMHYEDPYADLVIKLSKGYQHLDGNQAGQYVRFRSDELGDIGRVQRQQRFLKALAEQTFQIGNIPKLPAFIRTIDEYVTTDMTGFEMVKLVNNLKYFRPGNMSAEILPGNFATIDGLSYWVYDKEQTKQLIERMFSNDNVKMSGLFIP